MNMNINIFITEITSFFIIFIIFIKPENTKGDGICGEWKSYKDEKCFKLLDNYVAHNEAVELCKTQDSTLPSISSQEEQEFLQNYIFIEKKGLNTVWLGGKRDTNNNNNTFLWDDGNRFSYTNWDKDDVHNPGDDCVELEYSKLSSKLGQWQDIQCNKKNQVLCEKWQKWTLEKLSKSFLELRKDFIDYSIIAKQDQQNSTKLIQNLVSNPVPINFIYIQLPTQPEPNELWPGLKWEDVSSTYAGLFFRVLGGSSEKFGTIQAENSPRLASVEMNQTKKAVTRSIKIDIPANGDISGEIYAGSGTEANYEALDNHLKFKLSSGEVRPRNYAVKVWKRTK